MVEKFSERRPWTGEMADIDPVVVVFVVVVVNTISGRNVTLSYRNEKTKYKASRIKCVFFKMSQLRVSNGVKLNQPPSYSLHYVGIGYYSAGSLTLSSTEVPFSATATNLLTIKNILGNGAIGPYKQSSMTYKAFSTFAFCQFPFALYGRGSIQG